MTAENAADGGFHRDSEGDGRSTTIAYTFHDRSAAKQISQIDVTFPLVSTAKNGPAVSAVAKYFYDSNTYYDRRRLGVASDPHTRGVTETEYDGAGRRTEVHRATELEATKYVSGAFNYLDSGENLVEVTAYTLDEVGKILSNSSATCNDQAGRGGSWPVVR